MVEARRQIYIFLKHVFEEGIVEIYDYQNWTCFKLFSLIYFGFVRNFPELAPDRVFCWTDSNIALWWIGQVHKKVEGLGTEQGRENFGEF